MTPYTIGVLQTMNPDILMYSIISFVAIPMAMFVACCIFVAFQ